MPFNFGNKDEKNDFLKKHPIGQEDLDEVKEISEILNTDEEVLLVARQSRVKPGGSFHTPKIIYATDRRIIIRDPYMLGLRENIVDIPYDIIRSVRLEKMILSSTIRFKAIGLDSAKLGLIDGIVSGGTSEEVVIEAISKGKAEDLLEVIRSGMENSKSKTAPSKDQMSSELPESKEHSVAPNQYGSIADEIEKLAKLRERGILTDEEFRQMKQDLINRNRG